MNAFEWWCFEVLAIFAGLISVEALAAQVICGNIIMLIYMVALGTSFAASAFTGYFLGQMKIDLAKKYARLTILFNIIITVVIILALIVFHDQIASLFTQDPATVEIVGKLIYFMTIFVFFDTIFGVQMGIIRGLGLQVITAIYTLIVMYLIGLPLSLLFAFYLETGVIGLWYGFTLSQVVLDLGYLFICECPDWYRIAQKMQEKIDKEKTSQCMSVHADEL